MDQARLEQNLRETRIKHIKTPYFEGAERFMDAQWSNFIEPRIRGCDFSCVLDLACGHGRNAAKLRPLAGELYLVDINEHCIEACRARFEGVPGAPIRYLVNDGVSLAGIPDGAVSLVYSWDAVVHFDTLVVERYVHEFARVLRPGGRGFVHHSNYGAVAPDSNWLDNPHWRSNSSRERFAGYCRDAGLEITSQEVRPWGQVEELDCLSMFRRKA